ncbi:hypothetical protein [Acetobacter malorum]|uniref:hypothetical protein n=1 Tax=Acetobacter malorum TaxID=178901 RepID=UPI00248D7BF3|nr:hypothetical protein [Acetobacter malorum]
MISPNLNTFDRSGMTPLRLLRSMAPELRGVVVNLHDALKEMRSSVFRAGSIVLTDEQIARQASLGLDDLARTLPTILQAGFMARDDAGALYSPHLYDKALRSEARAARKAQADQRWEQAQASGAEEEGLSRKQITARENGKRGGRPRKNPVASAADQRSMPLLSVVPAGQDKNPNKKPNAVSVSGSVSSVSIDLESERDKNIPSCSISSEPTETETQPVAAAQVRQLAARMLSASGLGGDQAGFAVSFARGWLKDGVSADLIVSAIAAHRRKMDENRENPRTMGVFKAPVQRAISGEEVVQLVAEVAPDAPPPAPDWKRKADEAWMRQCSVFGAAVRDDGNYSRVQREWPEIAARNGLPPCERDRSAYEAFFQQNARAAA